MAKKEIKISKLGRLPGDSVMGSDLFAVSSTQPGSLPTTYNVSMDGLITYLNKVGISGGETVVYKGTAKPDSFFGEDGDQFNLFSDEKPYTIGLFDGNLDDWDGEVGLYDPMNPLVFTNDFYEKYIKINGEWILENGCCDLITSTEPYQEFLQFIPSPELDVNNDAVERFGWNISTNDKYLYSSSYPTESNSTPSIYVYDRNNINVVISEIKDTGIAFDCSDTHLVVGTAITTQSGLVNAGSAFITSVSDLEGITRISLDQPVGDIIESGLFGRDVAVGKTVAVVGSPGFIDGDVATISRAYGYDLNGTLLFTLISPEGYDDSQFGYTIDINDNYIVIGANYDYSPGNTSQDGAVHIYELDGTFFRTIPNPDPINWFRFGLTVGINDNNQIFIGGSVTKTPVNAENHGAVYIYNIDGSMVWKDESVIGSGYGFTGSITNEYVVASTGDEDEPKTKLYNILGDTLQEWDTLYIGLHITENIVGDDSTLYFSHLTDSGIEGVALGEIQVWNLINYKLGAVQQEAIDISNAYTDAKFAQTPENVYLTDGTVDMDLGYVPSRDLSLVPKGHFDDSVVPLDDAVFTQPHILGEYLKTIVNPTGDKGSFGYGMSIYLEDGEQYIAVSSPWDDMGGISDVGTAYIINPDNTVTNLIDPIPTASRKFGYSIDISSNIVVVGSNTSSNMAVWLYNIDGSHIITIDYTTSSAGRFVSCSDTRVAVGDVYNNDLGTARGCVWLYDHTGLLINTIYSSQNIDWMKFGVTFFENGNLYVAYERVEAGQVLRIDVFDEIDGSVKWSIAPNDPLIATNWAFGRDLASNGDILAVGCPYIKDDGKGSVYVYDCNNSDAFLFRLDIPVDHDNNDNNDTFGASVSVNENYIVVGNNRSGTSDGLERVFIYDLSGNLLEVLTPPVPPTVDHPKSSSSFGRNVDLTSTHLWVACPGGYGGTQDSYVGEIYQYDALSSSDGTTFYTKEETDNLDFGTF